jgi:hypothetical protein
MHESVLSAWESFYVIVGSSGGALIGLQFVVVTLIAERRKLATAGSLGAFGSPTVVHFGVALVISAILSAPWSTVGPPSSLLGLCGLFGIGYMAVVVRRARRQTAYTAVAEDWFWYGALPGLCYVLLTVSFYLLRHRTQAGLFLVGAIALSLLLIGIHNAWDSITHIVLTTADEDR